MTPLGRRAFLGIAAAGAAAVWGVGRSLTPRPVWAVPPDTDKPRDIRRKHRVAVVGGGLAGLSAAAELAGRGFEVELFEAGDDAGGRAGGWRSPVGGVETPQEHAFHAVFSHYYNLLDLIGRAGASGDYEARDRYTVQVRGRGAHELVATRGPFPWPMLRVVADSPLLETPDLMTSSADALLDLVRYDPARTFRELDDISFSEWCARTRVPAPMFQTLYDPFVRTVFVRPDEVSAAAVIRLMHTYFVSNPEGLAFSVQKRPAPESLIGPLISLVEKGGGRVHLSTPVAALAWAEGHLAGVVLRRHGTARVIGRAPSAQVQEGSWTPVQTPLGPVAVTRHAGRLVALRSTCTHQGCPVAWNEFAGRFQCPCHGGAFDASGAVVAGPPKRPLDPVDTKEEGGSVLLLSGLEAVEEVLPFDDVVLAMDPKGLSALASATAWPAAMRDWAQKILGMERCRPYSVARWWLDKPVLPGRPILSTLGGYSPLDELFIMSLFQEPAKAWAQASGGSVIETHCYALETADAADAESLADRALSTAFFLLPELLGSQVIHRELQLLDNFPLHAPGSHAGRPTTDTPAHNLHLAGDLVRMDLPAELMERAVISGRLAANRILDKCGLAPVPIRTPPLRGLLA